MANPNSSKATITQTDEFYLVAGARYVVTADLASGSVGTATLQFKNASGNWEDFSSSTGTLPSSEEVTVPQSSYVRWEITGGVSPVVDVDFVQITGFELVEGTSGGGTVDAASVQAALADDPQGALDALEGGTLTVDYLETADREGLLIPSGAYGQKSGVPYFGNSPLASQLLQRLDFTANLPNFGGANEILSGLIGGFTIAASDANDSRFWLVEIDLFMDGTGGGAAPSATDEIYVLVRFGTGLANLTEGAWIKVTPTALVEKSRIRAVIGIDESGGNIRPILDQVSRELVSATALNTTGSVKPDATVSVTNDASFLVPADASTSFQFYLVVNNHSAGFHDITATGTIKLSDNSVNTVNLV